MDYFKPDKSTIKIVETPRAHKSSSTSTVGMTANYPIYLILHTLALPSEGVGVLAVMVVNNCCDWSDLWCKCMKEGNYVYKTLFVKGKL